MPENQPVILFQHSCTLSPLFSKNQPIILMKKNEPADLTLNVARDSDAQRAKAGEPL